MSKAQFFNYTQVSHMPCLNCQCLFLLFICKLLLMLLCLKKTYAKILQSFVKKLDFHVLYCLLLPQPT